MYEIKNCGLEFNEFVRILVEGIVIGIVKILDGFYMVNDLLILFWWDDFLIKLNLLYVKKGDKFFICLLFCGKEVVYIKDYKVIVIDIVGKKLLEFVCFL